MSNDNEVYVLDFSNGINRAVIQGAKPGDTVHVMVRAEGDPSAAPFGAKGHRTPEGDRFSVTVDRGAEPRVHWWAWDKLQAAISAQAGSTPSQTGDGQVLH